MTFALTKENTPFERGVDDTRNSIKNDDSAKIRDTGKFSGTDNPREIRALIALRCRSRTREQIDREAGCSNGPDLIANLRQRGLSLPCNRIAVYDRDGLEVKRGVYHLTSSDRRKVNQWLAARGGNHGA